MGKPSQQKPQVTSKGDALQAAGFDYRARFSANFSAVRADPLQINDKCKTKRKEVTMAKSKKDFGQISAGRVYNTIAEATAEPEQAQEVLEAPAAQPARKERRTYTPEEIQAFKDELRTAGRKGAKLPRMNIAFAPEIYDYIQTMSRVRGETLTDFVNHVLRQSMDDYADIYKKAQEFRNSF